MNNSPQTPAGRGIAIAFLVIAVLAIAPALILGGWWQLALIVGIPAALFGIIGLAIELSKKGQQKS